MTALSRMFGSTVGRKYLVAVTGILLVLFLIGHLVGNLLLYAGRDAMNSYAQGLKNLGAGLWVIRAGLLAVFVVHISLAISLNLASKKARGVAYASPLKPQVSSFATRSMVLTGLLVLAYVVYHILHFTVGAIQPSGHALVQKLADGTERADVYSMVVAGFQNIAVSLSYVSREVGEAPLRDEARQPGEQAQVQRHRRRVRPRRRSAAATLGELGYKVKCFCYQDSPRRAHSIAAQGGINAAKNYQNDGDSVSASSTTRSRAATSAAAKPTSTAWPR
jgi:succinate dehydrogenase / fumarate reductase cytochrome b subunit